MTYFTDTIDLEGRSADNVASTLVTLTKKYAGDRLVHIVELTSKQALLLVFEESKNENCNV